MPRRKSMDEVGSALIAIALVLCAVFVPSAFITGISGQFYRQFALTIAGATIISLIVSLTLSPACARCCSKPHARSPRPAGGRGRSHGFFRLFNRGFEALARGYGWLAARIVRFAVIMLVAYAACHRLRPQRVPQDAGRLHPAARSGYLIVVTQLPRGASLARTDAVNRRVVDIAPEDAGRCPRGELRRLLGRDLHQCAELGRGVPSRSSRSRSARAIRRNPRPPSRRRCSSASPAIQEGLVMVVMRPAGARHRQRRRLPHDGRGPRRTAARRRCRAPSCAMMVQRRADARA